MFHVELAPLGGIFGPLKSDIGVFWPFWGTDFIMGKNHNSNFSKRARQNFLIFSLSSLFISVLKVPEEKLAVHNFWGWVLWGKCVPCGTGRPPLIEYIKGYIWSTTDTMFLVYFWKHFWCNCILCTSNSNLMISMNESSVHCVQSWWVVTPLSWVALSSVS